MSQLPAFLFCFLCLGVARAQFNDTLFLTSGEIKVVVVLQHDEKTVTYECLDRDGGKTEKRIPLKKLNAFVIYDDEGNLVRDSRNPKRRDP